MGWREFNDVRLSNTPDGRDVMELEERKKPEDDGMV